MPGVVLVRVPVLDGEVRQEGVVVVLGLLLHRHVDALHQVLRLAELAHVLQLGSKRLLS